jgi:hydrogenase assembly chaperone HypC/HupF
MCLGIPGQVIELVEGYHDQLALVDVVGARRQINVGMLEDPVRPGDWIMIHLGFAVEVVDRAAAERALGGLEMMGRPRDAALEGSP